MDDLIRCVVDEHVETPEFVERAIDDRRAVVLVLNVAGQRDRTSAGLLDPHLGVLRIPLFLWKVADQNVGALACEGNRDRAADAAVAARDERDLIRQAPEAAIRFLAVIGAWTHLSGRSG